MFLSCQTLSLLGSSLVQYAIMWHITLTTQSGLMMTLSIACGFVPASVFSPFAGVWADRFDRKKLIALADGGIAAVTLFAAWGCFRNRMRTMIASNLVMATCTLALGLAPWFWLYLAFMALFGIALPFFNTPSTVMLQEHVEPDYLGRVFSVMSMLSSSLMPLGMLAFGPLADAVRIEWILVATGLAMLARGISAFGNKRLIEAGEPVPGGADTARGHSP